MGKRKPRERLTRTALLAVGITAAVFAAVLIRGILLTGGELVYAVDDAYIHLAIAKNLAMHGVWGVTPLEAASASSSPLWTMILAFGMKLLGNRLWLPLILNAAIACLIIVMLDRQLRPYWRGWPRFGLLLLVALGAPFTALAFTGMEHLLHILYVLVFIALADAFFEGVPSARRLAGIGVLAFFMTLTRMESVALFLVPIIAAAARGRWSAALAPVAGSIAALALFASISIANGMPALPNSVLVKGGLPGGPAAILAKAFDQFRQNPEVGAFAIAMLLGLGFTWRRTTVVEKGLLATVTVALLLQASFGQLGQFNRYEAYLLVAGMVALARTLSGLGQRLGSGAWRLAPGFALAALCLIARAAVLHPRTPLAMNSIRQQQLQMARFVQEYAPKGNVVLNDIGAVGYYNEVHLLDLIGLATDEVRRLKRRREFDTAAIARLIDEHQPDVVILYESWFTSYGGLPKTLIPVADWLIADNVVCKDPNVTFFATSADQADQLLEDLRQFRRKLPASVKVTYWWGPHSEERPAPSPR